MGQIDGREGGMSTQSDGAPVAAAARLGRIAQNLAALLRLRLENARADVKTSVRGLAMGAAFGLAAFVLVLMALPLFVTVAILFLALYIPSWAAAGIVLLVVLAAAAVLLLAARRRLRWRGPSVIADLREDWAAIRAGLEERR
jgi:protein-S-isoprenylcysteine O-methyltransferase Ste14